MKRFEFFLGFIYLFGSYICVCFQLIVLSENLYGTFTPHKKKQMRGKAD